MNATRYSDTPEGHASEWCRGFVPGQQRVDFQDLLESLGAPRAREIKRQDEEDERE